MTTLGPGKRKAGMMILMVAWILAISWCITRSEARSPVEAAVDRNQLLFASLGDDAGGARRLCAGATCAESRAAIPETIGIQILTILTGGLLLHRK